MQIHLKYFDTIIKEPRILERAASVTESYDNFINEAQQWGRKLRFGRDMDKSLVHILTCFRNERGKT